MANLPPLSPEDLNSLDPLLQAVEQSMGFVPNSFYTMGRWPEMLQSFAVLAGTVLGSGEVEPGLKQLVALIVSNAAGCRYCQAHTSHGAERRGVDTAKIEAAFEFETSPLFDDAERAALRLALHAGMHPNATEPAHFDALKVHFSERQIVELVGVISLFGFLNRWNDTMATELEPSPIAFASNHLASAGWEPGKHQR